MKKIGRYWLIVVFLMVTILVVNFLGQNTLIADWYLTNVFDIWVNTLGRFNNIFPFSIGEVVLAFSIAWVIFLIILTIINAFHKVSFYLPLLKVFFVYFLIYALILSLNLSTLYHSSKIYLDNKTYQKEQLITLRNYILEKCNELADQVTRDEDGYLVYEADINQEIAQAYQLVSDEFPRLKGYYPNAKAMMGSYFMYQTNIHGVYFPHSLEAMYNKYASAASLGYTLAHELAHVKGYIYEDEATFLAYLACLNSDDLALQYSGYLGVLDYVNNDLYHEYLSEDTTISYFEYAGSVYANKLIIDDDVAYDQKTLEMLGAKNEIVGNISAEVSDAYYNFYNTKANYSDVTKLLLAYYDGILY